MRNAAPQQRGNSTAARLGGYSNRVCAAKINVVQIKIHWKPLRAGVRGGEILQVADQSRRLAPTTVSYIPKQGNDIAARLGGSSLRACAALVTIAKIKSHRKPPRAGVHGGEFSTVAD